jgi:hypothetical protein
MSSRRSKSTRRPAADGPGISKEEAAAALWEMGELRWLLYPDQRDPVYLPLRTAIDSQDGPKVWAVEVHRQFGKSFTACLLADEAARRNPGWQIRFVTGNQKSLRKIVQPNLRTLHESCPQTLKPAWNSLDACYRYGNGSEIHLAGANDGHADDSRGQRAHLCVVDEAAFVDDLDYLVGSVLLPQTLTTGGKVILISTPPVTPAHAFITYVESAAARGTHIKRTIDECQHLTDRQKESLIEELGGRHSTKARRELWCEHIVDEEYAVIPEFTEARRASIVQPVAPPTYEQPTVAIDVGFEDLTAVLYGYWCFRDARLHIQRESILKRARTDEVAAAIQASEAALWKENHRLAEPVRWSDTDLRLIADLGELHGLAVMPTAKDDKEAQVNALRMLVQQDKVRIDPSCRMLIGTLKVAVWNKARTQFDRLKDFGHADALDALIYLARNVDRYTNPYPAIAEGVSWQSHHIPRTALGDAPEQAAIKAMFGVRRRTG